MASLLLPKGPGCERASLNLSTNFTSVESWQTARLEGFSTSIDELGFPVRCSNLLSKLGFDLGHVQWIELKNDKVNILHNNLHRQVSCILIANGEDAAFLCQQWRDNSSANSWDDSSGIHPLVLRI
jgi:hypothetical protein